MSVQTPEVAPKSGRTKSWIVIGLIVLGVGVMVVVFAGRFGIDVSYVDSPLIGTEAPSLEFEYLNKAGTLKTDDLLGDVVVMNFWASWCGPCRTEHPALVEVSQRYADEGVRFLGVLHEDEPGRGTAFLDELGWGTDYDYVIGEGSGAAIEYGIYGIPETFVIDRNGIIAVKITGIATTESLTAAIETVLAGS